MTDDKISYSQTANFIWSVADLLRGDFKQSQQHQEEIVRLEAQTQRASQAAALPS